MTIGGTTFFTFSKFVIYRVAIMDNFDRLQNSLILIDDFCRRSQNYSHSISLNMLFQKLTQAGKEI